MLSWISGLLFHLSLVSVLAFLGSHHFALRANSPEPQRRTQYREDTTPRTQTHVSNINVSHRCIKIFWWSNTKYADVKDLM